MTIHRKGKSPRKIQIDLSGPQGNAFCLLGLAKNLCKKMDYTPEETKEFLDEMKSSDYEHLVETLDLKFGELIDFYR